MSKYNLDVLIVSAIPEDEAYDRLRGKPKRPPERIDISNKELITNMEIEKLRDSIVIFDDIEANADRDLTRSLIKLRDMLNAKGRHFGINTISVMHDVLSGNDTKLLHMEATHAVLFPAYNSPHGIRTYLKTYVGCNKESIERIMKLHSGAVIICNTITPCVISKGWICFKAETTSFCCTLFSQSVRDIG